MNEMAMTASFMRFSVYQKIFASWTGPTPRARPAMIAAMKHPVPVAESQLKSKRAASGVSLATTGAARDTALCSSGTAQTGVVARLMALLIAGRPHANTVSDKIANGIHALRIWPAVYLRAGVAPAGAAARSPSNLQTRFGRQNRRKITVATSEITPPAMSTRFESTWLDQIYCVTLNDAPTTRIAGSTSKVSAHPTIARTSQNGTIMPVMGRMRPIIALKSASGRPETAASVCTGVPIAPHATGDVLAIKLSAAAWNGLNPRPIMKAPAIATGAPNPAAPSMKAPKQNATSSSCNRRSAVMPATDSFMISNWPVNTEMSYRYTAASTIHAIFRTPNPTPYRKLMPASETGIPKTETATSTAVPAPAIAHQSGFNRSSASRPNRTRIGNAATSVDRIQLCSGSYTWVHVMAQSPLARWAAKTTPSERGSQGAPARALTRARRPCQRGSRTSGTESRHGPAARGGRHAFETSLLAHRSCRTPRHRTRARRQDDPGRRDHVSRHRGRHVLRRRRPLPARRRAKGELRRC